MKLLNKTSLIILTVALFIFFIGGITFYKIIQQMIIKQVDHELLYQKQNVIFELSTIPFEDKTYIVTENKIQIESVDMGVHVNEMFKDTIVLDKLKDLYVTNRLLRFHTTIGHRNYKITLYRSMLEAEKLIKQIVITMVLMMLALIFAMFFLNRYFFQRIWDNFFLTVNKVKHYNLHDDPNLNLPFSEIEEFQMLNEVFEKLTKRIHNDYTSLKEFTENASHEIQTPLSVMRAKIELLLQHPGYSDEQILQISSLNEAVNRLSNINKVLILLTRIENDQFPELSKVHIQERIAYHLENFKDIIESRNITVETIMDHDLVIQLNSSLADILIINLLKNAIRHNFDDGKLIIQLSSHSFQISNTGPNQNISSEQIFNRFVKTQNDKDSLGLGLALVKRICELYNFKIQYLYEDPWHAILVDFNQE